MAGPPGQLPLFDVTASPQPGVVRAAAVPNAVLQLASKIPLELKFGTSSWSFPGWNGLVWDGAYTETQLARAGLPAYAAHPLFRTVGLDRTFYAPASEADLQLYAAQLPHGFPVVMKAWDALVQPRFPDHARFGTRAGAANPAFLNPETFVDEIWPALQGFVDHLGAWLMEFPPMSMDAVGGPAGFVDRLGAFLDALPRALPVAVELRNPALLTAAYARCLHRHGATHAYNRWSQMPGIAQQVAVVGQPSGTTSVARWMLPAGGSYQARLAQCRPFDRLVDHDDATRRDLVELARAALGSGAQLLILVNNKAEGSAPLSVMALAQALVAASS